MPEQDQLQKKKKTDEPAKLEFEVGKVFSPADAKQDFDLGLDAARFKAQKGQSGDRKQV